LTSCRRVAITLSFGRSGMGSGLPVVTALGEASPGQPVTVNPLSTRGGRRVTLKTFLCRLPRTIIGLLDHVLNTRLSKCQILGAPHDTRPIDPLAKPRPGFYPLALTGLANNAMPPGSRIVPAEKWHGVAGFEVISSIRPLVYTGRGGPDSSRASLPFATVIDQATYRRICGAMAQMPTPCL
jgi:hypothetical protein